MVHSHQILKYVSTLKSAPRLHQAGCLFLPSDKSWQAFYSHLEHPYPPMFAEMVANAYYPNCASKSVSGVTMERCADGNVRSSDGCIKVQLIGMGGHVRIYASDGHIGLPYSWSSHMTRKSTSLTAKKDQQVVVQKMPIDRCSPSVTLAPLAEVPKNKKLLLPTRVIMCTKPGRELPEGFTELVKDQIRWTNQGYAGMNAYNRMYFDSERPQQTDMQIEFDLKAVEVQRDEQCATQTFSDIKNAAKFNVNGSAWMTIVLVADDMTGVLGMSTFPTEAEETANNLLVAISVRGLRHWQKFSSESWDPAYEEGHTMTHEVGHALGVFHTFEAGCSKEGDQVPDTVPEAYPHYTCQTGKSCGDDDDPVHNFMDYVTRAWLASPSTRRGGLGASWRSTGLPSSPRR
ncbi:unnamed protein product [Prorocentrum cordatum]|uniref:Peptidase M43 pregnancy-associated plasma-A domain-containing protein n=1 Tax=Prorocentrum cordatum TaxID=2364126 RepID=A0ABN9TPH4_9DINO|nr:unnamed protein product [Polarella glacialis]